MTGRSQHVVPRGNKWAVRKGGAEKVTRRFDTQREAIDAARGIARNQGGEVFIHVGTAASDSATPTATTPPRRAASTVWPTCPPRTTSTEARKLPVRRGLRSYPPGGPGLPRAICVEETVERLRADWPFHLLGLLVLIGSAYTVWSASGGTFSPPG